MRTPTRILLLLCILSWAWMAPVIETSAEDSVPLDGVPPDRVAHYLHSVIEGSRTIYSQYLVERLKETVGLDATENWEEDNTLPLPAQFLAMTSEHVRSQNLGLSYKLMSLWPINPKNGPASLLEKKGLQDVLASPDDPFVWIEENKNSLSYNTIFADKAVTRQCAACHNNHPESPKKDFKLGDVLGGIHIQFPIHRRTEGGKTDHYVLPEMAADYIHAILEADRTIYAQYVVHRLEKKKVNYASANWWENNALLLPAQFLLNASELIKTLRLNFDYRLISLWPINPNNRPANEFERTGLKFMSEIGRAHV